MSGNVLRIVDYERRHAGAPRDPTEAGATIFAFPRKRPTWREMQAILISLYGDAYLAAVDLLPFRLL